MTTATWEVMWGSEWECDGCGAHGDRVWDDDIRISSGHECDQDGGEVYWTGGWECHRCGASEDTDWDDGTSTDSHHHCEASDETEGATA